jgi:hypothetical protein
MIGWWPLRYPAASSEVGQLGAEQVEFGVDGVDHAQGQQHGLLRGQREPGASGQALAALGDQQIGLGRHAVAEQPAWMRCCQAVR